MSTWATEGAQMPSYSQSPLYADMNIQWMAGGAIEPILIMPGAADVRAGVEFDLYGRSTGTMAAVGGSAASWS